MTQLKVIAKNWLKIQLSILQVLLTHSESHNEGREATPSMAESKNSLPPNRPSLKSKSNGTKNFQGKSGRTLIHPNLSTHENTSPNIQHGNQNDRNYK